MAASPILLSRPHWIELIAISNERIVSGSSRVLSTVKF